MEELIAAPPKKKAVAESRLKRSAELAISPAELGALFCEKLNSLNVNKPFTTIAELVHDTWYAVNSIRHNMYRSGDEAFHTISIDMPDKILMTPHRHRNYIMREIFGLDENGRKIPNKATHFTASIIDDVLTIPGLQMLVKQAESNGKTYSNIHFRVEQEITPINLCQTASVSTNTSEAVTPISAAEAAIGTPIEGPIEGAIEID